MSTPQTRQQTLYHLMKLLDAANVPGDDVVEQVRGWREPSQKCCTTAEGQ